MKLTRSKKIFLIIIIAAFVLLLFSSNTAFAAINAEYSTTDTVPDTALEEAFSDSTLLNLLAKLVYAIGRFLEWILGTIFKMLTGSSDFPWADKIVFNAVPLLDVNFINPGGKINGIDYTEQTFVGQQAIQGVLKNTYATVLTLAATFFGIVVLITAIKLVVTTIASEKAKYKKAIVDWLVGFVMLFCIHYGISFIFYLNEQLVVVASKIVTEQLKAADVKASIQADAVAQELIDDVRDRGITYNGQLVADILDANTSILSTWMNALASNDTSKGLQEALMKDLRWTGLDTHINTDEQYKNLGMVISWAANANVSVEQLKTIKENIKVYYKSAFNAILYEDCIDLPDDYWEPEDINMYGSKEAYCEAAHTVNRQYNQAISHDDLSSVFYGKNGALDSIGFNAFKAALKLGEAGDDGFVAAQPSSKDNRIVVPAENTSDITSYKWYYLSSGSEVLGNKYKSEGIGEIITTNYYWTDILNDMITLKGSSDTSSGTSLAGSGKATRLISDLAGYFRYNSYNKERRTTNETAVKDGDKIYIQNMLMYAILVAQSLILFIAYVKRLFYVILLAMMAPIVVVFDFFQKFGK